MHEGRVGKRKNKINKKKVSTSLSINKWFLYTLLTSSFQLSKIWLLCVKCSICLSSSYTTSCNLINIFQPKYLKNNKIICNAVRTRKQHTYEVSCNVWGINSPSKRTKILNYLKKLNADICLLHKTHLLESEHKKLQMAQFTQIFFFISQFKEKRSSHSYKKKYTSCH